MTALRLWIADHRHALDDIETAVAYGAGAGLLDGLAQQGMTTQTLLIAIGAGVVRYLLALATKVKPPEPAPALITRIAVPQSNGPPLPGTFIPPIAVSEASGVTTPQPPSAPPG